MSRISWVEKLVARIEALLGQLAAVTFRHPLWTVALLLALSTAAQFGARQLALDTNLSAMLPENFPSVRYLETMEERFGGVGYVAVVGEHAPREAMQRFADDVAAAFRDHPGVAYVDDRRATDFFQKHALLYLETADLRSLAEQLQERIKWEKDQRNPLYMDFEQSSPPSLEFPQLREKYGEGGNPWLRAQREAVDGGSGYYYDADEQMIAVFIKPTFLSSDLQKTATLVDAVRSWVDAQDLSAYHPDLEAALAGRYAQRVEQQRSIQRDLAKASSLALALVLVYLLLHFRRLTGVLLMLVPLLLGIYWTFGWAGFIFGKLNVLSAFIGAILLGLGIDHGIHLLGRFQSEFHSGNPGETVIRTTFGQTGRAVVIAGLTTIVAFSGLGLSEFRAFHEFGVIAAIGMVMLLIAYTAVLPALLRVALAVGWKPSAAHQRREVAFGRWLVPRANKVLLVSIAAGMVCIALLPAARFNYNFRFLLGDQLPSYLLDLRLNEMLGYRKTPVVLLSDSPKHETLVVNALRKKHERLGPESTIDFVLARSDLVPDNQSTKLQVIERIEAALGQVKPQWVDADKRRYFNLLQRAVEAEPFTESDLPESVQRQFSPRGEGDAGSFVLVFPAISEDQGYEIVALANEIRQLDLPGEQRVRAAGEPLIVADILIMVWEEAPPVLTLIVAAVFGMVWLLLGSLRMALSALLPAAVTLVATTGLLPAVGLRVNYLNMVVIPVLMGVGVDGGVHLVTRLNDGGDLPTVLSETGRAIAASILTTALGFGSMIVTDQSGLQSVGTFAVLGLAVNHLACLVVLPAFLAWRRRASGLALEQQGETTAPSS